MGPARLVVGRAAAGPPRVEATLPLRRPRRLGPLGAAFASAARRRWHRRPPAAVHDGRPAPRHGGPGLRRDGPSRQRGRCGALRRPAGRRRAPRHRRGDRGRRGRRERRRHPHAAALLLRSGVDRAGIGGQPPGSSRREGGRCACPTPPGCGPAPPALRRGRYASTTSSSCPWTTPTTWPPAASRSPSCAPARGVVSRPMTCSSSSSPTNATGPLSRRRSAGSSGSCRAPRRRPVDALGDVFHAAGTCRMGDRADPGAVVDGAGRVIGYESLWIADASIFPTLPAANPMLTCVLVGERIVERIAAPDEIRCRRSRSSIGPPRNRDAVGTAAVHAASWNPAGGHPERSERFWTRREVLSRGPWGTRRACTSSVTGASPTCSPTAAGGGATPAWSSATARRCWSTPCSTSGSPREMLDGHGTGTRRARPIATLVNTHANGDHCYGNQLVGRRRDRRVDAPRPRRWPRCRRRCWPALTRRRARSATCSAAFFGAVRLRRASTLTAAHPHLRRSARPRRRRPRASS